MANRFQKYIDPMAANQQAAAAQAEALGGYNPHATFVETQPKTNRFAKYVAQEPLEQFGPPVEFEGNDAGVGNAYAYGVTGGQIPFGNVISSGIGAGLAAMPNYKTAIGKQETVPFNKGYKQIQADTKATQKAHPSATLAGNITGALSTLPIGISKAMMPAQGTNIASKTLAAIGNFARSSKAAKDASTLAKAGNLAVRSAKGAVVAAPVGALYGAGEADAGHRLEGAASGARLAAGVGATLPVAGAGALYTIGGLKNVAKGIGARGSEALEEAYKVIKGRSNEAYARMREVGAAFTPQKSNQIASKLSDTLSGDGPLNARLHDKTLSLFQDIRTELQSGGVTLENLDQWRQLLGQVASDSMDKINARKANLLIDVIDDEVDNVIDTDLVTGTREAVDALNLGRQEYKTARKFQSVVNILNKADGDPNKIKAGLKRFLDNPKNTRGFNAEEVMALQNAAKYTAPEGVIKALGKFGFDLGTSQTMGNTALPVVGGVMTGGKLTAAGTAARQTQKYIARGKAEELLKVLEAGGKVSQKEIMKLPPKDAKKLLEAMRGLKGAGQKTAVLQQQ